MKYLRKFEYTNEDIEDRDKPYLSFSDLNRLVKHFEKFFDKLGYTYYTYNNLRLEIYLEHVSLISLFKLEFNNRYFDMDSWSSWSEFNDFFNFFITIKSLEHEGGSFFYLDGVDDIISDISVNNYRLYKNINKYNI